ncbi:Uu.00g071680.m01.CDS01 [Anthostomella pinea]|uniref:Uu.00g071680.m01.CDS01 n=1 Tax=Anthostomella pinea TaxID=933095 RepID=A0AAI8VUY8_9PEZI|nr:Uu.00g071680.m01.CDS01 [Anthostomella pinea]
MPALLEFLPFPQLLTELRIQIWEVFVREVDTNRLVLIDGRRILPVQSLASPLLRVNTLSRHIALKWYPTRLPLYDMNKAARYRHFARLSVRNNKDRSLGLPVSSRGNPMRGTTTTTTTTNHLDYYGTLYLNLERDIFVVHKFGLQWRPDVPRKKGPDGEDDSGGTYVRSRCDSETPDAAESADFTESAEAA